jgi:hypothetical protein
MRRFLVVIFASNILFAQVENVPLSNWIYSFLKRMEVRGIIKNFDDASLPISRGDVAVYLEQIDRNRNKLSMSERRFLDLAMIEFAYELRRDSLYKSSVFEEPGGVFTNLFSDRSKYLYTYYDDNISFFVDFLYDNDLRFSRVDSFLVEKLDVFLAVIGGRMRGTYDDRFGFYIQATNGRVFGDKKLALKDFRLRQNYKLAEWAGSLYFDFTEAYLKYRLKFLEIQLGREIITQGYGFSGKLFISHTSPIFDFIRIGFKYRGVSYNFVHGWILGDDSIVAGVRFVNSKYIATHRLNFNFWGRFNFGIWEGIIYSGRFPEIAYLNPINFYKSAEHSLRDRDNALLGFDLKSNLFKNFQIYGTFLIDDIDFAKVGTGWYGNQTAFQIGLYWANLIRDFDLILEYTRIEPYVYSHKYRGNIYSHGGFLIGHYIGPNSDDFFVKIIYLLSGRAFVSFSFENIRSGENRVLPDGRILNYGGDYNLGHRPFDPDRVYFLSGDLKLVRKARFEFDYEIFKDICIRFFLEFRVTDFNGKRSEELLTSFKIKIDH